MYTIKGTQKRENTLNPYTHTHNPRTHTHTNNPRTHTHTQSAHTHTICTHKHINTRACLRAMQQQKAALAEASRSKGTSIRNKRGHKALQWQPRTARGVGQKTGKGRGREDKRIGSVEDDEETKRQHSNRRHARGEKECSPPCFPPDTSQEQAALEEKNSKRRKGIGKRWGVQGCVC
jgi:hypothetical protein